MSELRVELDGLVTGDDGEEKPCKVTMFVNPETGKTGYFLSYYMPEHGKNAFFPIYPEIKP